MIFQRPRFWQPPTSRINAGHPQARNVRFALSGANPDLRKFVPTTTVFTRFGTAVYSPNDNAMQFRRDLVFQNSDAVTVQVMLWVPGTPSGSSPTKIFGTRGVASADSANRRGWEVSLDGGTFVEPVIQVFDSGGNRFQDTANQATYGGTDVAAGVLFATFEVTRVPSTSTTLNVWLKPKSLAEASGTVTMAHYFDNDDGGVNFPEAGGAFVGAANVSDFRILQIIGRLGTITALERAAWYANPWAAFQPLPREIWVPSAGAATHTTSGVLASGDAAVTGAPLHPHTTTGTLASAASTVAGSALHPHTTIGALASGDSTVAGAALHPHTTTGTLAAQDATVAGSAVAPFLTSGALAAGDATVAGSAAHLTLHATSGALAAGDATITGDAASAFVASGALASGGASIAGSAAHLTLHDTTGALGADAAAVTGDADHASVTHDATGNLSAEAAAVVGAAQRFALHDATGALASGDASVSGSAAGPAVVSSGGGGGGRVRHRPARDWRAELEAERERDVARERLAMLAADDEMILALLQEQIDAGVFDQPGKTI